MSEPTHSQYELLLQIHKCNGSINKSEDDDLDAYWELVRAGYLKNLVCLPSDWTFTLTDKADKYLATKMPKPKKISIDFKITGINRHRVKIFVTGARGNWRAAFKIGVQTFYVCDRSTKAEALWYCKCLRAAFKNLEK